MACQWVLAAASMQMDGFLVAIATKTNVPGVTYNNGLAARKISFNHKDSRMGLQFSWASGEIKGVAQFIGRGSHTSFNSKNLATNLVFVAYRLDASTTVRAGLIKFNTFLVSEFIDVGFAYPWLRPPQELYILNPINNLTGVDLTYKIRVGLWKLIVQPYYGNNDAKTTVSAPIADGFGLAQGTEVEFIAKSLRGLNLSLGRKYMSLRLGYYLTKVDSSFGQGINDNAEMMSAGLTMDWRNLLIYTEYAARDEHGNVAQAFPDQQAYYVSLGYRMGRMLPFVTTAKIRKGKNDSPFALEQSSNTLGLRYELNHKAAIKMEFQHADPRGIGYGLFDAKIDFADIYSVGLDMVF